MKGKSRVSGGTGMYEFPTSTVMVDQIIRKLAVSLTESLHIRVPEKKSKIDTLIRDIESILGKDEKADVVLDRLWNDAASSEDEEQSFQTPANIRQANRNDDFKEPSSVEGQPGGKSGSHRTLDSPRKLTVSTVGGSGLILESRTGPSPVKDSYSLPDQSRSSTAKLATGTSIGSDDNKKNLLRFAWEQDFTVSRNSPQSHHNLGSLGNITSSDVVMVEHYSESRIPMLKPDGRTRRLSDILLLIAGMYTALVMPIWLGFRLVDHEHNTFVVVINGVCDAVYVWSLLISLRTGYVDSYTKTLVLDSSKVVRRYLSGWFLTDLLGCIPLFSVAGLVGLDLSTLRIATDDDGAASAVDHSSDGAKALLMAGVLVLKLMRFSRCVHSLLFDDTLGSPRSANVNPSLMRMGQLVLAFLFVLHLVACSFWFVATNSLQNAVEAWAGDDSETSLMEHWAPERGWAISASLYARYSYSFYRAFRLLNGNGILPEASDQFNFSALMVLVGIVVHSTIIGSASSLLSNMDAHAVARKAELDRIGQFLKYRKVPPTLQHRITTFYEYLWERGHSSSEKDMFSQLPVSLHAQLQLALKRDLVESVPLFRECDPAVVVDVVTRLRSVVAVPGEILIRQGETGDRMFFVHRGSVSVLHGPNLADAVEVATLHTGAHFGEIALLDTECERSSSVRAVTFCDLQVLLREDFVEVVQTFENGLGRNLARVAQYRHRMITNMSQAGMHKHTAGGPKQEQGRASASNRKQSRFMSWRKAAGEVVRGAVPKQEGAWFGRLEEAAQTVSTPSKKRTKKAGRAVSGVTDTVLTADDVDNRPSVRRRKSSLMASMEVVVASVRKGSWKFLAGSAAHMHVDGEGGPAPLYPVADVEDGGEARSGRVSEGGGEEKELHDSSSPTVSHPPQGGANALVDRHGGVYDAYVTTTEPVPTEGVVHAALAGARKGAEASGLEAVSAWQQAGTAVPSTENTGVSSLFVVVSSPPAAVAVPVPPLATPPDYAVSGSIGGGVVVESGLDRDADGIPPVDDAATDPVDTVQPSPPPRPSSSPPLLGPSSQAPLHDVASTVNVVAAADVVASRGESEQQQQQQQQHQQQQQQQGITFVPPRPTEAQVSPLPPPSSPPPSSVAAAVSPPPRLLPPLSAPTTTHTDAPPLTTTIDTTTTSCSVHVP